MSRALGAVRQIGIGSLCSFMDGLFERLDQLSDDRLHVAEFSIAAMNFRLRCSSSALRDRYLSRLFIQPPVAGPFLRIDVVSTAELGWPACQWSEPGWQMHIFDEAVAAGGYQADYPYFDRQWIVRQSRSGNCCYMIENMDDLLPWDSGSPIRLFLNWSLLAQRRRMVHAGSLGFEGKGVLLAGPGGSGKSGTTLAGLAHGLTTVGDDYLLLDQTSRPTASPLYRLIKQDPKGISRIPGLGDRVGEAVLNWQGKLEFNPCSVFPGAFVDRLELRAVLLPVVAKSQETTFEPVHRAEAIRFLASAMLDQLPSDPARMLLFFGGITAQLPVYRIRLSEDSREIAAAVRRMIEGKHHGA